MAKWTRDSIEDVRDAWDYIAADNRPAADQTLERVYAAVSLVDEHPFIGRAGQEPGTRELVVARTHYILIYRVVNNTVEVLRVLHGKQEWPSKG